MTDPVFTLLNRTQAQIDANEMIEATRPLLQELVNYSTSVYKRCVHAGNSSFEDLPSFILYLHIVEMTDGIQVLLSHSCCEPALPLIRSSFEAFISLQYFFQENDYRRRCLCWLYCDYLEKKRVQKQLDKESGQGKEFAHALNLESPDIQLPTLTPEQLKYIYSPVDDPTFIPIKKEYERVKKEEGINRPPWYRLFEGPKDLQRLAKKVKMENYYITFYREWSAIAHAGSSSRYLKKLSNGTVVGHQLRFSKNLLLYAYWAGFFIWKATDLMLMQFRPHEPNHYKWSVHIKKQLVELLEAKVRVKKIRL